MTQEIIEMAQECGLVGMRPHLDGIYIESLLAFAKLVADKALAEHAMQEVQRLGQEIEQEPVAWIYDPITERIITPQRTWVGLTDREIDELWMSHHDDFGNPLSATGYERAIEAKLKEKNT